MCLRVIFRSQLPVLHVIDFSLFLHVLFPQPEIFLLLTNIMSHSSGLSSNGTVSLDHPIFSYSDSKIDIITPSFRLSEPSV